MQSYVVPCASSFRDSVLAAAQARNATVSDLARAVLLIMDPDTLARYPDPGDAPAGDREEVTLKSGRTAGRTLRRKPRLQLRLHPDLDSPTIRRALAAALALLGRRDRLTGAGEADPNALPAEMPPQAAQLVADLRAENDGLRARLASLESHLDEAGALPAPQSLAEAKTEISRLATEVESLRTRLAEAEDNAAQRGELEATRDENAQLRDEVERLKSELEDGEAVRQAREEAEQLRAAMATVAFDPLPDGVRNQRDALYVLGFPPHTRPSLDTVKHKFRLLSHIYHPDKIFGDDRRMGQLVDAVKLLQTTRL